MRDKEQRAGMPRKKSLAVNYLLNTSCQIFLLAVPLITTPYLSRTLGAGGVGVYSYTYAMVSYFLLFAVLGTNTYGQRAYRMTNTCAAAGFLKFWRSGFWRPRFAAWPICSTS